jgi:predicted lipase
MAFDPKFSRDVYLPLAVHAYTVAGIPQGCESFDASKYNVAGLIEVDPAKCAEVWSRLQDETRASDQPSAASRANEMLAAAMADSHIFGFVASTDTDAFICIRGTHSITDWLKDADLPLVDYRFRSTAAGLVHMGFQAVYETIRQSILDLVAKTRKQSLTLIGHSLGAALATVCSLDEGLLAAAGRPRDHVVPIASPRVGNEVFRDVFNGMVPQCFRIVNKPDLVPHLPLPIGYIHVGTAAVVDSGATLDLGFAHGLCEGYLRGLNKAIAAPMTLHTFA